MTAVSGEVTCCRRNTSELEDSHSNYSECSPEGKDRERRRSSQQLGLAHVAACARPRSLASRAEGTHEARMAKNLGI